MLCFFIFFKMLMASVLVLLLLFSPEDDAEILDLPEGSKCVTNNVTGTCVKMHTCSMLVVDLMAPNGEKVYPEVCSYDGETPIVCCTSCKDDLKFDNISDAVYAPSGILFIKSGRKVQDKCLEYSQYASSRCWLQGGVIKKWYEEEQCHYLAEWFFHAAGGIGADREEFTHMALLGYGSTLAEVEWLCGGSLISENFIVTAAHCTAQPRLGPVAYAALGILKRSDPKELWQTYKIKKIIPYPEYKSPSKYHDIALLKTEKPVTFNRAVFPACIMMLADEDHEMKLRDVTAIGWGALGNHKKMADTLQVIKIHSFYDSECSYQYQAHRHLNKGYDPTTQMCYGERRKAVDTCQGDSGGPLQSEYVALCMYALIGVTSFGRSCGYPGQAGMYTRIRYYVPWIEAVVWPEL